MVYDLIRKKGKKKAVLIDPDKYTETHLLRVIEMSEHVDMFLVGGSLMMSNIENSIKLLKQNSDKPVVIFPGSTYQLSSRADALLLLSLISGRNPEYLIGNHVVAAQLIRKSKLEVIPTGYILIEGGTTTSVEYISNTKPIPASKTDIIVSTAIAGEMLGLRSIYLETGSGAASHVPADAIREVRRTISLPLIVGGGIRSEKDMDLILKSGADMIVVGNGIEKNPGLLKKFRNV